MALVNDGLQKEDLAKRQPYPEYKQKLPIALTDKKSKLISKMLPHHFFALRRKRLLLNYLIN